MVGITNPDNETYKCTHGGPGELVVEDKKLFILSYEHNLKQLHKQIVRALYPQIIATELSLLEEMITSNVTIMSMIDSSLVKLLFSMATNELISLEQHAKANATATATTPTSKPNLEQAKIYTRCAIYLATYLQLGEKQFWNLLNTSSADEQSQPNHKLHSMHVGINQVATDDGLVKLLNVQIPCQCLQSIFPALVSDNNKK